MGERLDIEYCKNCEDVYATYPQVWLCFNVLDGETTVADDKTFTCPRCYTVIERHRGYLEALEKRDSPSYIESVLIEIIDLSPQAIILLRTMLANFTVPSFAVHLDGKPGKIMDELVKKRYIEVTQSNQVLFAVLNAQKLGLFDNLAILEKMGNQQGFIRHPEYVKVNDIHSKRRKARKEALVDDFTEDQRAVMLAKFGNKCALTGLDVPLHVDHVLPLAIGHGGTTLPNMLPIWQRINTSKGTKNLFEWYEEDGERFGVCPELFAKTIEYLAELNGMSPLEYRDYVYKCHANPNDILTEVE